MSFSRLREVTGAVLIMSVKFSVGIHLNVYTLMFLYLVVITYIAAIYILTVTFIHKKVKISVSIISKSS